MTTDRRSLLEFKDVSLTFGADSPVLRGLSFDIQEGEFVSLLGPSGCGKSTALNLCAGLLNPDSGSIDYDGYRVRDVNTGIGYMTQHDTLLPWRRVEGNIGLPLKLRGVPRAEIAARTAELLELMQLTPHARKWPGQLSGGMKRRALLARSLITRPKLILMDEPFAALDAQLRRRMQEELRTTVQNFGQAVLFVTHDIAECVLVSDRVVVLSMEGPSLVETMDLSDLRAAGGVAAHELLTERSSDFDRVSADLWLMVERAQATAGAGVAVAGALIRGDRRE